MPFFLSIMNFSAKQVSLFFRSKKGSWELVMEIENLITFDGSRKKNLPLKGLYCD
jgi:hypothetical protein